MSAGGIPIHIPTLVNASGAPRSGARVFSYVPDSSGNPTATARTLYTSPDAITTPAANPYVSGTSGQSVLYRKPSEGVVIVIQGATGASDAATVYSTTHYPAGVTVDSLGDEWLELLELDAQVFHVDAYGADPTGVADSTDAIQAASAALEAAGSGILRGARGGTYKVYPDTSDTASLGDFDNCKGVYLDFPGCTFTIARAFTGTQTIFPWVFEGCDSIGWSDHTVVCAQVDTPADSYQRGIVWLTFIDLNTQVSGGFLKQTGGKGAVDFARSSATVTNRTSGARIKRIETTSVGYPLQFRNSGDDTDIGYVLATNATRPIIGYGFKNLSAIVERVSTGASGESQMLFVASGTGSEVGNGDTLTEGLELWYKSNTAPANSAHIAIEARGTSGVTLRDFDIHMDVEMDGSGGLSQQAFAFYKTSSSGVYDSATRGHTLEDFVLRGNIRDVPATRIFDFFNTALGDWSGETRRNFRIEDMSVAGSAASSLIGDWRGMTGLRINNFDFPGTQQWKGTQPNTDRSNANILCNGSMAIAQRGTSFTSTSSANNDDVYTLDRWVLLSDGNDTVDVTRETTIIPTGARFSMALDVETANRKFGILQILEASDCMGLFGKKVTFQFKARKGGSNATAETLRFAILTWSSTSNVVTSDVVSAWEAAGTNPTLAANWTYENTPQSVTLTTDWTTYAVSALIDTASAANIAVFIWCDDTDATVADLIYIADCKLEAGTDITPFVGKPQAEELMKARRYYQAVSVYVPATTAQNLRAINMIGVPTIAGGGSGFDSTGTTADSLIGFQTTGAVAALTLDAEL